MLAHDHLKGIEIPLQVHLVPTSPVSGDVTPSPLCLTPQLLGDAVVRVRVLQSWDLP